MASPYTPFNQNAFYDAANFTIGNRLKSLYAQQDSEDRQFKLEDRQRKIDAEKASAQSDADNHQRELVTKVYAPLARQALESNDPHGFIYGLLNNPATAQLLQQDGIIDAEDLNDPELPQNLAALASMGEQPKAPTYGQPIAGVGPDGKPVFQRFSNDRPEGVAVPGFAPAPPASAAPKGPDWALVAQTLPDGKTQQVWVDRNNPNAAPRTFGAPSAAARDPKVTEGERTAANYLLRMESAEQGLGNYQPTAKDQILFARALNSGEGLASLANANISPDAQQYFQYASDWARAKLRKESGASISPSEIIQEVRTYFPLPGDSTQVVEQKRAARQTAVEGMKLMAGSAASQVHAPQSPSQTPKGPVRVNTPQEAMALPPGTQFVTPDGRVKVRP